MGREKIVANESFPVGDPFCRLSLSFGGGGGFFKSADQKVQNSFCWYKQTIRCEYFHHPLHRAGGDQTRRFPSAVVNVM